MKLVMEFDRRTAGRRERKVPSFLGPSYHQSRIASAFSI
jgi:hypothetical protein